jgi:hypothetical protein
VIEHLRPEETFNGVAINYCSYKIRYDARKKREQAEVIKKPGPIFFF